MDIRDHVPPPVQILGGTCPPCPIGIDALDSAENLSYLRSYGNEKAKNLEKRKVRSHNKVR